MVRGRDAGPCRRLIGLPGDGRLSLTSRSLDAAQAYSGGSARREGAGGVKCACASAYLCQLAVLGWGRLDSFSEFSPQKLSPVLELPPLGT